VPVADTLSGFRDLTRDQLAALVPELLLAGQLIDRAGLPHVIGALGPDAMTEIAIEEWLGASPVYTKRMQAALDFAGDDVVTIFKGLQLDIGAPPQFMDFRYTVYDRDHGEFALAHCGALMDVEPMGEAYVRRMCHDIEDPTFDGTALATNPKAQVRPIHRPPREPADRTPHCAWTVRIDDANEPAATPPQTLLIARTAAALFDGVTAIDPGEEGCGDYRGPLLADVVFGRFSHSALVRIAEEVCLQGHLLTLSFLLALRARTDEAAAVRMTRQQFTGVAGVAAARIRRALELPRDLRGAAALLAVHPGLNPRGYTGSCVEVGDEAITLRIERSAPADGDGSWPALLDAQNLRPIDAIVRAADPRLRAEPVCDDAAALTVRIAAGTAEREEFAEVQMTRFSTGASFVFTDRSRVLPLAPAGG
jgi:hypothetical protein